MTNIHILKNMLIFAFYKIQLYWLFLNLDNLFKNNKKFCL